MSNKLLFRTRYPLIISKQNPLVKHLVKLREDKSYRREKSSLLVTGKILVEELAASYSFTNIVIEEGFSFPQNVQARDVIAVSFPVLKKITGLENPEPICGEIACPREQDVSGASKLLVLDRISDPGNLGTLLRTALALRWDGVFLTHQCVDIWNDKAIRAARGSSFFLPFQIGTTEELECLLQKRGGSCLVADARGKEVRDLHLKSPLTLILGNESHGPLEKFRTHLTLVGIPLHPKVESLNVSIAGAILMDQLRGL